MLYAHSFYRYALHLGETAPGDGQPFNAVLRQPNALYPGHKQS